jgi:hypothetical protein
VKREATADTDTRPGVMMFSPLLDDGGGGDDVAVSTVSTAAGAVVVGVVGLAVNPPRGLRRDVDGLVGEVSVVLAVCVPRPRPRPRADGVGEGGSFEVGSL